MFFLLAQDFGTHFDYVESTSNAVHELDEVVPDLLQIFPEGNTYV